MEIETNGTLAPTGIPETVQFNVSPKLENSHNSKSERFKPEVLASFLNYPKAYLYIPLFAFLLHRFLALSALFNDERRYFKFVVGKGEDWEEIKEIVNSIQIPRERY